MNVSTIASIIDALGWTLLHFVWQGAMVAVTLWCFLRLAQKASPQIRYAAGCTALSLMSFWAVSTFVRQLDVSDVHATSPPTATRVDSTAPGLAREGSAGKAPVDSETAADDSLRVARGLPATEEPAAIPTQPVASHVTDFRALASRLRPWLPWIAVTKLTERGVLVNKLPFFRVGALYGANLLPVGRGVLVNC